MSAAQEYQKFVSNIASTIAEQFRSAEPEPAAREAAATVPAAALTAPEPSDVDREKFVWTFPDTAARLIEDVS